VACLFTKRLERGRFVWPAAKEGKVSCCWFRGHEDKIVTKESEIGNETEVYERVQV